MRSLFFRLPGFLSLLAVSMTSFFSMNLLHASEENLYLKWGESFLLHELTFARGKVLEESATRNPQIKEKMAKSSFKKELFLQLLLAQKAASLLSQNTTLIPNPSSLHEKLNHAKKALAKGEWQKIQAAKAATDLKPLASSFFGASAASLYDIPKITCSIESESLSSHLLMAPTSKESLISAITKASHKDLRCASYHLLQSNTPHTKTPLPLLSALLVIKPEAFTELASLRLFMAISYLKQQNYPETLRHLHKLALARSHFKNHYAKLQTIYNYHQLGTGDVALKGL